MRALRFILLTVLIGALLCATAYGAGYTVQALDHHERPDTAPTAADEPPAPPPVGNPNQQADLGDPTGDTGDTGDTDPTDDTGDNQDQPTKPTKPTTQKEPALTPGPALLSAADSGEPVRDLQARLKQIAWLSGTVTGAYDDATVAAVRGFQAKREIPVTGDVDQRTLDRLHAMTHEPTHEEKHNIAPPTGATDAALDSRCRTGRTLCIDKSSNTLRWVVDGTVVSSYDVRFGASATPTREGLFSVQSKSRDHVSSLYDSPMPFAMFFSGGQAVHYSSDFAARGYNGASHGCVNMRDHDGIAWLFDQVRVGDKVVVFWS